MKSTLLVTAAVVALGGCSGGVVSGSEETRPYEAPTIQIVSPLPDVIFQTGEVIPFEARVGRTDFDDRDYTHRWLSGFEALCGRVDLPANGIARCDASFPATGTYEVSVSVVPAGSEAVTASIVVRVVGNQAPTIDVEAPTDGETYPSDGELLLQAKVSDVETAPQDLVVTIISSVDGQLDLPTSPNADGLWRHRAQMSPGVHQLRFDVVDVAGAHADATVEVTLNAPPNPPRIHIEPTTAIAGDPLRVQFDEESVDPDGGEVSYTYKWYRNDALFSNVSRPDVGPGQTERGEVWRVVVTPRDDYVVGESAEAVAPIVNAPPTFQALELTPPEPTANDTIKAVASGWYDHDGDPERYRYEWTINGVALDDVLGDLLVAGGTRPGDSVGVRVSALDDFGAGTVLEAEPVVIANNPPGAPTIEINPDSAEPGVALSCDVVEPAVDPDGDTVTYTYRWYRNGNATEYTTAILDGSLTSLNESWSCGVVASDGYLASDEVSASARIEDVTAPNPPLLEDRPRALNAAAITFAGTCETGSVVTLRCTNDVRDVARGAVCSEDGSFEADIDLPQGAPSHCTAVATDLSGNASAASNTIVSEFCAITDEYEDEDGSGNTADDAIDDFPTLADDNSQTITVVGNVINADDEDWFVFDTTDDRAADESAGIDYYRFWVNMTQGKGTYALEAFAGTVTQEDQECRGQTYDSYEFHNQDPLVGTHPNVTDRRECGPVSAVEIMECADYSSLYYVRVYRKQGVPFDCQPYELQVSNGAPP